MLPGWCCIAGTLEPVNGQLIPHVRFQVPFLGPESRLKSGSACAGLLCSKLNKRRCNFPSVARILRFCGLIFGTARRCQKWDRENDFLLFF